MEVGNLTFEVLPGKTGQTLTVRGGIYALESNVTPDELRALARSLEREAEKLTNTKGD